MCGVGVGAPTASGRQEVHRYRAVQEYSRINTITAVVYMKQHRLVDETEKIKLHSSRSAELLPVRFH